MGRCSDQRFGWLLATVAALSAAVLGWRGLDRAAWLDPADAWPWAGGDTWDWIAAGLVLRGVPIEAGERPPLLPALTALADSVGLLAVAGLLGLVAMVAVVLPLWRSGAERTSCLAATAAGLALVINQSWIRSGLEWMVDVPAGAAMAVAVSHLAPASGPPRWRRAGLWLGCATVLSQVAMVLVVLWPLVWIEGRPTGAERRRALLGGALAVTPASAWFASKLLRFDTVAEVGGGYWRLLGFDPGGLLPYLWQVLAAWGWLGCLLALVGLGALVRRSGQSRDVVWVAAPLLVGGFFALAYRYEAPRFAVTALPLLVIPTAIGLGRLQAGLRQSVAAVLLVAGAIAPLGEFELRGAEVPLVPGWRLQAPLDWRFDGSLAPRPLDAALVRATASWRDLAWFSVAERLERARAESSAGQAPTKLPVGVILFDDVGVVRYQSSRRLAVLARAPVAVLPPSARERLCAAGEAWRRGGFVLRRLAEPHTRATWWVASPVGLDPEYRCEAPLEPAGREVARSVLTAAAGVHLLVEVDPQHDWWVWLALLQPSERLHVVERLDLPTIEAAARGARRPIGGLESLLLESLPIEILDRQGLAVWRDQGTAGPSLEPRR